MVVNQLGSATTSVHPGMGANLFDDECSFRVWAPNAIDNARGIVVDWQQQWSEFATPKFEDLIIYEAHVGSFAGLNDHLNISTYATFDDFQTKLGYIRELGFNALQLLPTEQVDGIDGEGYGATNLFAPHNGYGTPQELRSLVMVACCRSDSARNNVIVGVASLKETRCFPPKSGICCWFLWLRLRLEVVSYN